MNLMGQWGSPLSNYTRATPSGKGRSTSKKTNQMCACQGMQAPLNLSPSLALVHLGFEKGPRAQLQRKFPQRLILLLAAKTGLLGSGTF